MNPAHLSRLFFAVTLAACGEPSTRTLSLPHSVGSEGSHTTVDLWVFGGADGEPTVRAFDTGLRRAEWLPTEARTTPVGARQLRVTLTRAAGEFELEGSNSIWFLGSSVRPRVFSTPQAVSWLPGSRTVLVVGHLLSRVSLLTPSGVPLPSEQFVCAAAPEEMLESFVTRCTLRDATPLSGSGPQRSVKVRVEDGGDVWVLPELALP